MKIFPFVDSLLGFDVLGKIHGCLARVEPVALILSFSLKRTSTDFLAVHESSGEGKLNESAPANSLSEGSKLLYIFKALRKNSSPSLSKLDIECFTRFAARLRSGGYK